MPGFWSFLMLYVAKFGAKNIHIISHTNDASLVTASGRDSWVVRFIKDLGLPELGMPLSNIHLVKDRMGPGGKGPVAKAVGCTHYIDDSGKACP